jgi:cbb3-type cytochrome oxidase subunit 3
MVGIGIQEIMVLAVLGVVLIAVIFFVFRAGKKDD